MVKISFRRVRVIYVISNGVVFFFSLICDIALIFVTHCYDFFLPFLVQVMKPEPTEFMSHQLIFKDFDQVFPGRKNGSAITPCDYT